MKRMRSVRVAIAALVLVAGVVGYLALLPEPKAMPSPGVCTYYSSAKFKTVVGQFGTGCCGEVIGWATTLLDATERVHRAFIAAHGPAPFAGYPQFDSHKREPSSVSSE